MQAVALVVILFAIASTLLLLVLVLAATCAFRHHRGSRYHILSLDHAPSSPPLSVGLLPADIRRLLSFAFPSTRSCADDDTVTDSPSYPVCLDAARVGERRRVMSAFTHAFHAACVDR